MEVASTETMERLPRPNAFAPLFFHAARASTALPKGAAFTQLFTLLCALKEYLHLEGKLVGFRAARPSEARGSRFGHLAAARHLVLLTQCEQLGYAHVRVSAHPWLQQIEVVDLVRAPRIRFLVWVGLQLHKRHSAPPFFFIWCECIVPLCRARDSRRVRLSHAPVVR